MPFGFDALAPRVTGVAQQIGVMTDLAEIERRQRADDRALSPNLVGAILTGGATTGLTQIEGTDTTSPVVPAPVDAATIVDGLWIVQGSVQVTYSGGTGNIRARLVTSGGSPISDWYYGPADDVNSGAIVPAHFAVFGNSDAVRLQFESLPNTGVVSTISGTITGYLVGSLPT